MIATREFRERLPEFLRSHADAFQVRLSYPMPIGPVSFNDPWPDARSMRCEKTYEVTLPDGITKKILCIRAFCERRMSDPMDNDDEIALSQPMERMILSLGYDNRKGEVHLTTGSSRGPNEDHSVRCLLSLLLMDLGHTRAPSAYEDLSLIWALAGGQHGWEILSA
ncbi:hypothetical protein CYLTODRAFT_81270 [Cylindrobasidium torrendii FP15055 ss-10]|uniref:Uncharacterized protein n=1 Tax=Cylindrobasidium torrendii FP15055 ss-10 TaxID=1314674 RepID=A0A0D7B395_9AGAR|nr:hypothetical protein CYLTODRAFT_81270 [Cylindrobasidium torrendii FP15055 ss-10]